jgi:hypothetical protein
MIGNMRLSVVCGVMNREEHLWASLSSWLMCDEIDEIVLVDWSSRTPVTSEDVCDPRVVIVRVEGQEHWVASKCHNLGLLLSTGYLVLRLDADDILYYTFFAKHSFKQDEIPVGYSVDQRQARDDNETHLAGVVYARRCDFLAVGGYNERIEVYGYEDTDLICRMTSRGSLGHTIDLDTLRHQQHDESSRFANQPQAKFDDLHRYYGRRSWSYNLLGKGDRAITANKLASEENPWTAADRKARWKIEQLGSRLYVCEEIVP